MSESMRLYGFWRSTATWRVRIALAWKNLEVPVTPIDVGRGEQRDQEFLQKNPMAHVPVLAVTDAGRTIHLAESLAILEWLEERFPSPPLLPTDSFARAKSRQIALLVASGIQPLVNTKVQIHVRDVLRVDERAWVRRFVEPGLVAVEAVVNETRGAFAVGDQPSFADVCIVPQLHFARRFDCDLRPCPSLVAIEAACAALPAFQRAHADRQPDAPRAP
jgi:maleylpyruvate isomerase